MTKQEESRFQARLARHHDELRWLYMELYDNGSMFAELCDQMHRFADQRKAALKKRDLAREQSRTGTSTATCWDRCSTSTTLRGT